MCFWAWVRFQYCELDDKNHMEFNFFPCSDQQKKGFTSICKNMLMPDDGDDEKKNIETLPRVYVQSSSMSKIEERAGIYP